MDKFFGTPFAATGDKTPVPTTVQPTGSVSYPEGFGSDYQADQTTDPDAKDIPRGSMNQLFYDLSNAMREYQVSGVPDFITSAQNGGTPYSYSINAHVRYNDEIYESRINSNTDLPTVSASWRKISGSQQGNLIAEAAGTVNAMTAAFSPSLTAYQKGVPLFIRAFGANSSGTPTLNVDGLGAKTICKGANTELAAGDIPGAGYWMILQYDQAIDKMVLANPAGGAKAPKNFSANDWTVNSEGLITQWGVLTNVALNQTFYSVVFPLPFPNAVRNVQASIAMSNYVTGAISTVSRNITNSGFQVCGDNSSDTSSGDIYWQAIGW